MLSFPAVLINAASIVMIAVIILYAFQKRRNAAVIQFIAAAFFMLIWAVSSFVEMTVVSFEMKVIWRNITQIGVFYVPPASMFFAVAYSGIFKKSKKWLAIPVYSVQTASILLIFTDGWHHLMRKSIEIVQTGIDTVITVESTLLSSCLISLNFVYMAASLIMLIVYAVQTAHSMRKQVLITLGGMSIAVVYAFMKVVSSESIAQFLPISGVFALVSLILLLGIFKYDFLAVLPVARNEVFNIIDEGILVCTAKGEVLDANDAAIRMFSNDAQKPVERNTNGFAVIGELLRNKYSRWYEALVNCRFDRFDISQELSERTNYYHCRTYVLDKKMKQAIGTISVLRDVTEQRIKNDLLKYRAEHDSLIDIYNRHTFIEIVDSELKHYTKEASLVFFDLDDFKNINDSYGHLAGDYVLREVCCSIKQTIGIDSIIGRMGGEEFAVFFMGRNLEDSVITADKLRKDIEGKSFEFGSKKIKVTISAGVAEGSGLSFIELYQTADKMLYQAKEAGKNCIMP